MNVLSHPGHLKGKVEAKASGLSFLNRLHLENYVYMPLLQTFLNRRVYSHFRRQIELINLLMGGDATLTERDEMGIRLIFTCISETIKNYAAINYSLFVSY